jgi:hypothetical protein
MNHYSELTSLSLAWVNMLLALKVLNLEFYSKLYRSIMKGVFECIHSHCAISWFLLRKYSSNGSIE